MCDDAVDPRGLIMGSDAKGQTPGLENKGISALTEMRYTLGISLCVVWMVAFLKNQPYGIDLTSAFGFPKYLVYYALLLVCYVIAFVVFRRKDSISRRMQLAGAFVTTATLEALSLVYILAPGVFASPFMTLFVLIVLCLGQISCVLLHFLALVSLPSAREVVIVSAFGSVLCILMAYALLAMGSLVPLTALLPLFAYACLYDLYPQRGSACIEPVHRGTGVARMVIFIALLAALPGFVTLFEIDAFFDVDRGLAIFVHTAAMMLPVLILALVGRTHVISQLSCILIMHICTKLINLIYYTASYFFVIEYKDQVLFALLTVTVFLLVGLLCFSHFFDVVKYSIMSSIHGGEEHLRVGDIVERYGLTPREVEVFQLLAEGRSLPYIQEKLSISGGTARTHASSIYRKLGIHSRQELIDLARSLLKNY